MTYLLRLILCVFVVLSFSCPQLWNCSAADIEQSPVKLYIDADFSNSASSSNAIKNGILTALYENDNKIAGREVELVLLDHHGNSRRSKFNLLEYDKDPDALAVYCGLHSPPVLVNLEMIQQQQILLLDPWAAAGPITRKTDAAGRNWVFRLSVDDTKAGDVLVSCAVDTEGYSKPALLLEDTGWGNSNQRTITAALNKRGIEPADVVFFNWKLGRAGAAEILSDIKDSGADVILMVANAPEGKTILRAMSDREESERLPLRSHWGITGGDLFASIGKDVLNDKVDLKFLQTSFSFLDPDLPVYTENVFSNLQRIDPGVSSKEALSAPAGFIHAYDLTKLLITAAGSIDWQGRAVDNRERVRGALERIDVPVRGLIKEYKNPFRVYSANDPDAHEALSLKDLRMAEYDSFGSIRLINDKGNNTGEKNIQ